MKKIILSLAFIAVALTSTVAQDSKVVRLEQTEGAFTVQELTLKEGTYVFEITNNGVDHKVGFVLAPEGKTDAKNHIKEAYVKKPVVDGSASESNAVTLKKGEYVYFCPMNPTPQYKLKVI